MMVMKSHVLRRCMSYIRLYVSYYHSRVSRFLRPSRMSACAVHLVSKTKECVVGSVCKDKGVLGRDGRVERGLSVILKRLGS